MDKKNDTNHPIADHPEITKLLLKQKKNCLLKFHFEFKKRRNPDI